MNKEELKPMPGEIGIYTTPTGEVVYKKFPAPEIDPTLNELYFCDNCKKGTFHNPVFINIGNSNAAQLLACEICNNQIEVQ